jgi:hypothetical protein
MPEPGKRMPVMNTVEPSGLATTACALFSWMWSR